MEGEQHHRVRGWAPDSVSGVESWLSLPPVGVLMHNWMSLWVVAVVVKNPLANAGDLRDAGSIPGLGRSAEEEHGNALQYSCLENPMDRGPQQARVRRVAKSQTRLKQLSMHTHGCLHLPICKMKIMIITANIYFYLLPNRYSSEHFPYINQLTLT